jgi:hypothetical protein
MLNGVMADGEASYFDDLPVTLERSGYTEECYFTFCYAPVHDEAGKVGGIFGTVSETTTRVVGERRLQILLELSDIARAVDSAAEVCAHAVTGFPALTGPGTGAVPAFCAAGGLIGVSW